MLSRRSGYRWVVILVGSGAALSFLAQIVAGEKLSLWLRIVIAGVGMVCIGVSSALPLIQQREYDLDRHQREMTVAAGRLDARRELQDSITPAAAILCAIAAERETERRNELKSELTRAIVSRSAREIGPDRTRACYYKFEKGPPKSLICHDVWEGRDTRPSEPYTEKTQLGRGALTMVTRRESSFRANLDVSAPTGWPRNREYKTYIAVTVAAKSQIFGMLTVDSLRPGDLSEDDVPQTQMLADFLAIGLTTRSEVGAADESTPASML